MLNNIRKLPAGVMDEQSCCMYLMGNSRIYVGNSRMYVGKCRKNSVYRMRLLEKSPVYVGKKFR
jgi:hypothetical protein